MKHLRLTASDAVAGNPNFNEAVSTLSDALSAGGIIAFPADTIWGLGVSGAHLGAIERLKRLKGRRTDHPFPVFVHSNEMAWQLSSSQNAIARKLAKAYWPGALTLVLPMTTRAYSGLAGPDGTVGFRVPASGILREVMTQLGHPIVNTSANKTGETPLVNAREVIQILGSSLDVVLELEEAPAGLPSTVIRPGDDSFEILRHGAISRDDVQATCELLFLRR